MKTTVARLLALLVLALPSLGFAAPRKVVLGKLGQAVDTTGIRSKMSVNSRIYYRVKKYEYLIINPAPNSKWLKVLLRNGTSGYIIADRVARLPYNVTSTASSTQSPLVTGSSPKLAMLNMSFQYVGTPYKWGGNDLSRGIDCSGFVKQLFGKIGVNLPRTAAQQAQYGVPVQRLEQLQAGDRLYFYDRKRGKIGHTGIFLGFFKDGGAYFIHSSSGHHGVATDDLRKGHWRQILVAARR